MMNAETITAWATVFAALMGPVAAVCITLAWERHRRVREQQQLLLQTLLATRGRYADPSYSWAIRTVPLHFSSASKVMAAHVSYMDTVRFEPSPENLEKHGEEAGRRLGILISEMLQSLGYKGLSAEQVEQYTARGLADRERLIERALEALPYIAFNAKRSADSAEAVAVKILAQPESPPSEVR